MVLPKSNTFCRSVFDVRKPCCKWHLCVNYSKNGPEDESNLDENVSCVLKACLDSD